MFIKILSGALNRQKKKFSLIVLTIGLGVSLATAMLNVMLVVGDKVNQELKAYGANLTIMPRGASYVNEMYQINASLKDSSQFIIESELVKIKMIFWAYNITDFTPYLNVKAQINNNKIDIIGTWFNKHLVIPTGDEVDTGMLAMKSWWSIDGNIMKDINQNEAMIGASVASQFNLKIGDSFTIKVPETNEMQTLMVNSIFNSGGAEDAQIYIPLLTAQKLAHKKGLVDRVDVRALATPENELARRAAQNPDSLSLSERDTWYCTAYISSIAYQLEEVMPNVRVKTVMQVAKSEGEILNKTQFLMLLLTVLSLVCSALAISNLVTANIIERSAEIGLLKALGAANRAIAFSIIFELLVVGFIGGFLGYFLGISFAKIIGYTIFGTTIEFKMLVIPLVTLMVFIIVFLGSLPALRIMFFLRPTDVLHGR